MAKKNSKSNQPKAKAPKKDAKDTLLEKVKPTKTADHDGSLGFESALWSSADKLSANMDASEYLGTSKETLYRLLDRRTIPGHRIGRIWKFKPFEVDAWIKSSGATDTTETIKSEPAND